jgi:hypothetical protein
MCNDETEPPYSSLLFDRFLRVQAELQLALERHEEIGGWSSRIQSDLERFVVFPPWLNLGLTAPLAPQPWIDQHILAVPVHQRFGLCKEK